MTISMAMMISDDAAKDDTCDARVVKMMWMLRMGTLKMLRLIG